MKIQVLVATMHQVNGDYSLIEKMNIQTDAVIINQCDRSWRKEFYLEGKRILWIDTEERGLSKSRNMALENASANVCVIADDDEVFLPKYAQVIEKSYFQNPNHDILRFKIEGIERPFKHYSDSECNMSFVKSMKVSSVELAFKRDSVWRNCISFDELIGAGTKFLMGEENAFIWECIRKGMKVHYVPKTIANLHMGSSTWFNGHNKDYFVGRGAAFTAMSRKISIILILQFAARRKKMYQDEITMTSAIKYMLQGRKEYLIMRNKQV